MLTDLGLTDLGWDEPLAAALPAHTVPARVVRVDRGAALVLTDDGAAHARLAARVRRAATDDPVATPCTGDWVALARADDECVVTAVLPRRTAVTRGGVARVSRGGLSGDGHGQVLAANVDVVLVAEPARHGDGPADLGRIERLIALAWQSGARPVAVVTKTDLLPAGPDELLAEVAATVPGADVHAVAALADVGLDAVRAHLGPGRTAVVLGPSGAGKSTLVNALAGYEVMPTQQVRAADGRGRHTTVHRELVALPGGGLIIDTPGLRRVGLYAMTDGLDRVFTDVEGLALGCRFADCAHRTEPGCAVLAAVDAGALPERRLESWRGLRREAAWMATRTDARLRSEATKARRRVARSRRRDGFSRP